METEFSGIEQRLERLKKCLIKLEPHNFAQKFAPIAGFRNILIHEYLDIDWDEVYKNLKKIDQFYKFMDYIKKWLSQRR